MKHELIKYTDRALLDLVTELFLKSNPKLKLGDKPNSSLPVFQALDGKVVVNDPKEELYNEKTVELPFAPQVETPRSSQTIHVKSIKIRMDELADHDFSKYVSFYGHACYLHPQSVRVPHREWLENVQIGDHVCGRFGHEFPVNVVKIPVTQEIIDHNSYIIYSFGISEV